MTKGADMTANRRPTVTPVQCIVILLLVAVIIWAAITLLVES